MCQDRNFLLEEQAIEQGFIETCNQMLPNYLVGVCFAYEQIRRKFTDQNKTMKIVNAEAFKSINTTLDLLKNNLNNIHCGNNELLIGIIRIDEGLNTYTIAHENILAAATTPLFRGAIDTYNMINDATKQSSLYPHQKAQQNNHYDLMFKECINSLKSRKINLA